MKKKSDILQKTKKIGKVKIQKQVICLKILIVKKLEKFQVLQFNVVKNYMKFHRDFNNELIDLLLKLNMKNNQMNALLIQI